MIKKCEICDPLTAENIVRDIVEAADWGHPWRHQAVIDIESYAAQQNAELVADVKLLRAALDDSPHSTACGEFLMHHISHDKKYCFCHKKFLAATDRPEYKEVG